MERYSVIRDKNPREIVLLRGNGCKWKKCTFCDYHKDSSTNEMENYMLNQSVIEQITGEYEKIEVVNSGSFVDLNEETIILLRKKLKSVGIHTLHIECHWLHRNKLKEFRDFFGEYDIKVIFKIGIETFDINYRENILCKGIGSYTGKEISDEGFEEINLLVGLQGQTVESIKEDIEMGLRYFSRVCVNVMVENSTSILPNKHVIERFLNELYPQYIENDRVDILIENKDFGVG